MFYRASSDSALYASVVDDDDADDNDDVMNVLQSQLRLSVVCQCC